MANAGEMEANRSWTFAFLIAAVAVLITSTVGWRPVLGARSRHFEPAPDRMTRGQLSRRGARLTRLSLPTERRTATSNRASVPAFWRRPRPGDEDLFGSCATGRVGACALNPPMPWRVFRNMSDDDLKSIFAHLRTVKPVHNRLDNSEIGGR
jgi:hypothetical protein